MLPLHPHHHLCPPDPVPSPVGAAGLAHSGMCPKDLGAFGLPDPYGAGAGCPSLSPAGGGGRQEGGTWSPCSLSEIPTAWLGIRWPECHRDSFGIIQNISGGQIKPTWGWECCLMGKDQGSPWPMSGQSQDISHPLPCLSFSTCALTPARSTGRSPEEKVLETPHRNGNPIS